jgi:hypothetical protein
MPIDRFRALRRVLVRTAVLVWTVVFGAFHVHEVAVPAEPGHVGASERLAIRWIERSLGDGGVGSASAAFPEGELFTWEFWGLSLQNVAETTREPEDVARAVHEARALLPRIDALVSHAPFAVMARRAPRGGVCWFAGQNLVRARLIAMAPDATPAEIARFHADSEALARAFERSPTGVLEAHPGMTWPVDSLFGYRSLQIHDGLYGTRYAASFARWKATVRAGADRRTGLMPSFVHLDGRPRDVPRGCALSWSLAVLPDLDPAFAAEQWSAYRGSFGRCAGGLCLFREYPPGVDRAMDGDTGLIVAGLGMSASAFALAAARAQGDTQTAEALRRTGELFGLPAASWWGKRYLGGAVALVDIFALWTRTVPMPASAPAPAVSWSLALGLAAFWLGLAAAQVRGTRRAFRDVRAARAGAPFEAALCLLAFLALAVHLGSPAFPAPLLVAAWLAIGVVRRVLGASPASASAVSVASGCSARRTR